MTLSVAAQQRQNDIVHALEARNVHYLVLPVLETEQACLYTPALIRALAQNSDARFREALIPLFIRHPEYADLVQPIAAELEPNAATTLRHMYTAAMYLQRMWRTALSIYLGKFPLLPDYFGESLFHLPSPDEYFGEIGLRALAEYFEARTGYTWLSLYHSSMKLTFAHLEMLADAQVRRVGEPSR